MLEEGKLVGKVKYHLWIKSVGYREQGWDVFLCSSDGVSSCVARLHNLCEGKEGSPDQRSCTL